MVSLNIALYLNETDFKVYSQHKEHLNGLARDSVKKELSKIAGAKNGKM